MSVSKFQKDVKSSKTSQIVKKMSNVKKSNTWTMEEVHKNKLTYILTSILTSHIKVIKIGQKYFLWTFSVFLVTIICDVKIDVNMMVFLRGCCGLSKKVQFFSTFGTV